MNILHTESSNGWGGQEIRILKEAEGMRQAGHVVILAVVRGGKLIERARAAGFIVYELNFKKSSALFTILRLLTLIKKHDIHLVNTHSSLDAWLGGIAARIARKKIVRTRHLSTPIRSGINSRLLYRALVDYVATTSSSIIPMITKQSGLPSSKCSCVPTGVDEKSIAVDLKEAAAFRKKWGVKTQDLLVGTVCFVRSWKGIKDFMKAALLLKDKKDIKWVIIGGGYIHEYEPLADELGIRDILWFTGHLESPFNAMAALDVFALLSTAHEGISQASLQAAFLEKPLVTTPIGGLPEVCLHEKTGLIVPPFSPDKVAEAVLRLQREKELRRELGKNAKALVLEKFTFQNTLRGMEEIYQKIRVSS